MMYYAIHNLDRKQKDCSNAQIYLNHVGICKIGFLCYMTEGFVCHTSQNDMSFTMTNATTLYTLLIKDLDWP